MEKEPFDVRLNRIGTTEKYTFSWYDPEWDTHGYVTLISEEAVDLLGLYNDYFTKDEPYTVIIDGEPRTYQPEIWHGKMPREVLKKYLRK